ncbi:acyl-CoA thioesterase [Saccharospirillum salsuginis]|uniref:Acyl-CoA thioesterase n=1 Tax=Saccharospirillum salsuginis TaxID=418750 RepID=A0A918NHC6_9GAMM|nr:acyl-CoA thioesterase [Saccharospirillum salsuginis]GGX67753.1 acyl-CoA thioesterase [Saccharospirillum salsuginis]
MTRLDEKNPTPRGELQLRVVAQPKDTNTNGDISGGWLVTHMDMAASIAADRIARGRTTTMAIGEMSFVRPVRVGSVICCYTRILGMGRSSIRIGIEVWCRMPEDEERQKVTETEIVYVAIDDNRRIRALPQTESTEVIN